MLRALAIAIGMSAVFTSELHAGRPIVDITIQTRSSAGPRPISGWTFSPVDLNKGVGGKYIYFGWKRGSASRAVTSLGFGAFGDAQQDNPWPDWEWNRSDLNRGAGGAYIYTFWKRGGPAYRPIHNVTFIVTSQSSPPPIPGYHAIHLDLNKGAGGPYIWPYVSFESADEVLTASRKAIASAQSSADGDTSGKAVLARDELGEVVGKSEEEGYAEAKSDAE